MASIESMDLPPQMHGASIMHEPSLILDAIKPVLSQIPKWWLDAKSQYDDNIDEDKHLILGTGYQALYIQRYAVNYMHCDPIVTGAFHPVLRRNLQMLQYDGVEADVGIMFKKLYRYKSRLKSSGWVTDQQRDRRDGQLRINGKEIYTLVCGPIWNNGEYEKILIGFENHQGFEWAYPLWNPGDGVVIPAPEDQLSLFPAARVKIRQPDSVADADTIRVGINKNRADKGRRDKDRPGDSIGHGA